MANWKRRARAMCSVLVSHTARHPLWEVEDMYKLVHQAAMGSEHAILNEAAARVWLLREFREIGRGPDEPLIDPISPDGSIVRVHLRPFAQLGLDAEMLLAAFLRTAREFRGSTLLLESGLADVVELAGEGLIAADPAEVELLAARMKASGYRAVHHSAAYVDAYHPAYRVVARELLPPRLLSRSKGYGGHGHAARDP